MDLIHLHVCALHGEEVDLCVGRVFYKASIIMTYFIYFLKLIKMRYDAFLQHSYHTYTLKYFID